MYSMTFSETSVAVCVVSRLGIQFQMNVLKCWDVVTSRWLDVGLNPLPVKRSRQWCCTHAPKVRSRLDKYVLIRQCDCDSNGRADTKQTGVSRAAFVKRVNDDTEA